MLPLGCFRWPAADPLLHSSRFTMLGKRPGIEREKERGGKKERERERDSEREREMERERESILQLRSGRAVAKG